MLWPEYLCAYFCIAYTFSAIQIIQHELQQKAANVEKSY